MENIFFEIIKILVSLFVGILPFIATILTIIYYVHRDEKNKKIEKKREEKRFLREKLEIITNEILEDNRQISLIFYEIFKTSIQEVKKNIVYERNYQKSFLLSLLYFEDLNYLIVHYEQRTAKLFELMNSQLTEEKENELFEKAYLEEYKEISVSFGERPVINNGRQGVYSEILKQLKIEAKKLVD